MKKAYLAISYSNGKYFNNEINALKSFFKSKNIDLLVFVDKYNFKPNQEQEMMQTAFKEIDESDFLIAELTTKSIGVGIEMGYAFANNKPVFYLYKQDAEYSTTAAGTAKHIIKYIDEVDLIEKIEKLK